MSSSSNIIWIDRDAAGFGWSTDASIVRSGQIDLLSVVSHEFGHVLGLDHDVMGETLTVGTRETAWSDFRIDSDELDFPLYALLTDLKDEGIDSDGTGLQVIELDLLTSEGFLPIKLRLIVVRAQVLKVLAAVGRRWDAQIIDLLLATDSMSAAGLGCALHQTAATFKSP